MRYRFYITLLIPLFLIILLFMFSNYIFLFPSIEKSIIQQKKLMIKELTHLVIEVIDNCYAANKDSLSEKEIQNIALEQIRRINYGDEKKSYFWVCDLTPTMIMHPYRQNLEGKDLSEFEDINGVRLFENAVTMVKSRDEGYLEYHWQWQDDSTKIIPKITFVKAYEKWGWIIATGIYIDDIDIDLLEFRKNELKSTFGIALLVLGFVISAIRYGLKAEKQKQSDQNKLELSEQKFRNLFQNSNDIIIVSNFNGEILDINNKALTTYGLKYHDIVGKTTFDMMPEKYHELVRERVKSAINKELDPIEIELTPQKNQKIHVEIKSSVISFNNNNFLLSTMRDITTRKIQNQKLIESRLHYKIVADYTSDWEYWIGEDGRFKYISPSCSRVSGYGPDEFMNNPKLYTDIIIPEHKTQWNTHHVNALEHHIGNEVIEFCIKHKNGHLVWIEHSCQPIYDNNKNYIGARGSNRDISIRKKAEQKLIITNKSLIASEAKFKNLSNMTFEGIALHSNGFLIETNLSLLKMFGYTQKELLNKDAVEILFDKHSQLNIKLNIAKSYTKPYEAIGIRKDGSRFPVEIEDKDYHTENDGSVLRVSAIRDITERKMYEKQVLNAIISGEEKERTRIAKELHDGLGPYLSTMKFYFQWLAESDDEKKKKVIIEKGNDSMHEAITILREISNNLNPHILTNYGLMDAIDAFISKFEDNELIEFNFTPIKEDKINHNIEVALYRIVIELINNTLKHANASKIYITFKKIEETKLKMMYADDGDGFEYDPNNKKTAGIGLLNIQNRVSTLDGELEIKTAPKKGFIAKVILNTF